MLFSRVFYIHFSLNFFTISFNTILTAFRQIFFNEFCRNSQMKTSELLIINCYVRFSPERLILLSDMKKVDYEILGTNYKSLNSWGHQRKKDPRGCFP